MSEPSGSPSSQPVTPPAAADASPPRRRGAGARALTQVVLAAVIAAVVGIVAAWVWMALADPPQQFLGPADFEAEAGVTVWYWIVGVPIGLIAGLVWGMRGERDGPWALVPVVVFCCVAAGVCGWAGSAWFAPERAQQAEIYVEYQYVAGAAGLEGPQSVLVWLAAGLVGFVSAVWTWDREAARR